jgi:DNA-binding GntR family transcriptional regulator
MCIMGALGGTKSPLKRNVSTEVSELIRDAIMDGRLEPGLRLKHEELARDLGISRTPIRDALHILQTEGLIQSLPNRGAVVREYTPDDIAEMYELRALLEGWAARKAAERISSGSIARLEKSCERFETLREKDNLRELVKENLRFHTTIMEAVGSERLTALIHKVTNLPLVYRSYNWYSDEQKQISEYYHKQITKALESKEAERAEALMREHVMEARDVVIKRLRERAETGPLEAAE